MSALSLRNRFMAQIAAMGSAETGVEKRVSEPREACGALSRRTGEPCKVKVTYPNGRCHMHGGPSTGPKTAAGFAQVRLNLQAAHAQRARQREEREADEQRRQQEERRRAEHPPTAGAVQTSAVPPPPQAMTAYNWYRMHSRDRRPRFAKT